MVDDVKAALLPAGPLSGGDGFLHVRLRTRHGCFVRHGVGPGVGPPSHGALGHLDGGGAAAGREQRRGGQASGEAWEEKTLDCGYLWICGWRRVHEEGAVMRLMLWGSGACYGEAEPPI